MGTHGNEVRFRYPFCNLQPEIFIVKPTIPTNKTQPAKLRCYEQCIRILNKKSSMKCHACQLGIVAMLVVQSCYGWDFTSNLDGWTDSKGSKKKHLDPISLGEGTQRSSSRTESMPEKMPAFGWGNMLVSRWVTTYVAFHGFFWGQALPVIIKNHFFTSLRFIYPVRFERLLFTFSGVLYT